MKLYLKLACPDCGKRSSWLNYIVRRYCPNCKTEFAMTKYSILSCCLVVAMIVGMTTFGIFEVDFPSLEGIVIILVSAIISLAISPFAIRMISKKTAKELNPPKKTTLRASYMLQAFLLAFAMFWIMLSLLAISKNLKLSLPDYLLDLYPSFTRVSMHLIPATEQLFFLVAGVIAGGYLFFALIMLLSCPQRKLFSYGIRLLETSYKFIIFITIFALAGLFISFIPYYLNLSEQAGEVAINICNNILWILFILIPLLVWFLRKKSNHTLSSVNRKLILLSLANPILISLLACLLIILMMDLSSWWFEGEPMSLCMEFFIGKNYVYNILITLFVICFYFIIFTKNSHSAKKMRYKINFCLAMNRFSLLTLLIYTCMIAHMITYTCMGYTQCMCGGHEPWNKTIYTNLNWLALGISIVMIVLIFLLSRKIKNKNKCKWIYLTGILIFAIFYFPINQKIHPTVTKTGFINKQGKMVISPQFAHAGIFKSGLCNASLTRFSFLNLQGFINKKGEWIIAPKFISVYPFSEGFSSVTPSLRSMSRFINTKGEFLNTIEYRRAYSFSEGMALVEIGQWSNGYSKSKSGYINTKGEFIILKPDNSESGNFAEGLARVVIKANSNEEVLGFGKIAKTLKKPVLDGEESLFNTEEENRKSFTIDMVTFINKSGSFAIKNKGKAASPMIFLEAGNFSEGLVWVKVEIDSEGKVNYVPDITYSMFGDSKKNTKVGFINKSGDFIIKPQFHYAKEFKEGMAPVKLRGSWGFVNKQGELIVNFKYTEAYGFSGGLARVYSRNKYGFIDKSGKEVIPIIYEGASDFAEGLAAVQKDGLWGYLNKTGKFVIQPEFHHAWQFSEGLAAVGVKIDY